MVHTKLDVWQKAMDLTTEIYKITTKFPENEKYTLAKQIRKAAVSISSDIAEGAGRFSNKEFTRFLHIAMGSIAELETHTGRFEQPGSIRRILCGMSDS